jgi:ubiquinone/menaquinone biosynthesis C-methylase UbiE
MDDTDYAFGRSRAEYDRLIEQAELLRPLTERVLRAAGIAGGMRVLDVGCGVGDVSFLVATLVGPEGSVVGVDLDAEALKLAEERRTARESPTSSSASRMRDQSMSSGSSTPRSAASYSFI